MQLQLFISITLMVVESKNVEKYILILLITFPMAIVYPAV